MTTLYDPALCPPCFDERQFRFIFAEYPPLALELASGRVHHRVPRGFRAEKESLCWLCPAPILRGHHAIHHWNQYLRAFDNTLLAHVECFVAREYGNQLERARRAEAFRRDPMSVLDRRIA